mmetsp:Transcript_24195/g.78843  ORF Transcript_24195/g.78843 Transcript_24195/m.78843 type:complete len:393 (+) Transcript_24195:257-1435(+)
MGLNDHGVQLVPVTRTRGLFSHLLFLHSIASHSFGPTGRKFILQLSGSSGKAKLTSFSLSLIEALKPSDPFAVFLQNLILRHLRSFRDQGLLCILMFLELALSTCQPCDHQERESLSESERLETLAGSKSFGVHVEFLSSLDCSLLHRDSSSHIRQQHLSIALAALEEWILDYFAWASCPVVIRWASGENISTCPLNNEHDAAQLTHGKHQHRQEWFLRSILRSVLVPKLSFRLNGREISFLVDLVMEAFRSVEEKASFRIFPVPGLSVLSSKVVQGLVIDASIPSDSRLRAEVDRSRIVLFDVALEPFDGSAYQHAATGAFQFSRHRNVSENGDEDALRHLRHLVENLHRSRVHVLACQRGIDPAIQEECLRRGILPLERLSVRHMKSLQV